MPTRVEDFVRWLEARGIADERLAEYRECAEHILREAGDAPLGPHHVQAARRSLEASGAAPRTVAHCRDAADALRRYLRADAPQPALPRSPSATDRSQTMAIALGVAATAVVVVGIAAGVLMLSTRHPTTPADRTTGGSSAASAASPEEAEIRRVYGSFQEAMTAGDIARLRTLAADDQLADLTAPGAEEKLALARALYPANATIAGVKVTGTAAVITASALMDGQRATGRIDLVRQGAQWKIRKAGWKVTLSAEPATAPKRDIARPADFPRLVGTWTGTETTGATDWTLVFSEGHRMAARSGRGESYEGEVVIRWDLGIEGDSLRVPPGWAPLDVEIDKASHAQAVGKVTLAAFSLSGEQLRFCGGPPGHMARVKSFESPGAPFRCVVLRRASAEVAAPTGEANQQPEPASQGEATLLLDGKAERYEAKTDFFSDTRLAAPHKAAIEFRVRAPEHSNARRIVISLDATHVGRHYADGQAIHDMMFNGKPVAIGQTRGGAKAAVLTWIADGGQQYPPKIGTRCEITVTSPYTGDADGELRAEIAQCTVHSAGIDHTLAAVKMRLKGRVER